MTQLPVTNENIRNIVARWCNNTQIDREEIIQVYGTISDWNTSHVTDMNELFRGRSTFNDDISRWDVSNVTSMHEMFRGASSFNQPIRSWQVDNVTNMHGMFSGASSFNQPLDGWIMAQCLNGRHHLINHSTIGL